MYSLACTLPGSVPLLLDALALTNMNGMCRSLALDAAVPIEMASTAPLGQDTDLVVVRAGQVGAGLGRPVAAAALEVVGKGCGLVQLQFAEGAEQTQRQGPGGPIVEASEAVPRIAFAALGPMLRRVPAQGVRGT